MLRCLVALRRCLSCAHRPGCAFTIRKDVANTQRVTFARAFSITASHGEEKREQTSSNLIKRARAKAVHDFCLLVSGRNVQLLDPKLQTPHDIKGFYRAIKAKEQLHQLSSEEFTAVIQLFGSISVLPEELEQPPSVEADSFGASAVHPLAPVLLKRQADRKRGHWGFVLSVAKDKFSCGLTLSDSDNYWLMRAALEDAKRYASQDPKGKAVAQCLDRAKTYYARIKSLKDQWSVHRIYINALLDVGGPTYSNEIILRLGNLLSWNSGLHTSFHNILWRVVSLPGDLVSAKGKAQFLSILRKRLSQIEDVLPRPSTDSLSGASVTTKWSRTYDAQAIRDCFVDIMFSVRPGTRYALRYLREVYPWALFECRAALCAFNDGTYATSEEGDHAAWNNLLLLSLSFPAARKTSGPANVAPEKGLEGGVHSQAQVLGWTVICSLAALSSELHLRLRSRKLTNLPSVEGIQEISRTLWVLWRKEEAWRAGAVTRSIPLICSATTSFMALASVSGDARLAIALVRHISDSVIYPARFGGETLDRHTLQAFAVHFAILTVTTGVGGPPQHSWDGIIGNLRHAQLIPDGEAPNAIQWNNSLANAFLADLAPLDPMLAHKLLASSIEYGIMPDSDAVLLIGKALADEGRLDLAVECMRDDRISEHCAALLLDALLLNILRYHHDDLRLDLVRSLVNIFVDTSIRPTNTRYLQAFLQACLNAGYIKELINILEIVCTSNPTLLRSQFLAQLVSVLVSHHHYRLLSRVLKGTLRKMPDAHDAMFRSSQLQYTGRLLRRSSCTSSREIARSLPFSIYVWPLLRDHIPFHPRLAQLDKRIISLKLSGGLQKAGKLDEKTLEHAVHLLVSWGRVSAALKLLSKHSPTISSKAGNIILSASLRPRTSRKKYRQLRHASARLAQLVKERGFVPDRVTFNLLMKALLRWKSITPATTLRSLFNQLTLNGYPIPVDFLSMSTEPAPQLAQGQNTSSTVTTPRLLFSSDTRSKAKNPLPVNLEAFSKHNSFSQHVRPLYRMFIKAFKARGDTIGARRVREVLRGVKENVMRERAIRDEARRIGRIKAREKTLGSGKLSVEKSGK